MRQGNRAFRHNPCSKRPFEQCKAGAAAVQPVHPLVRGHFRRCTPLVRP